MSTELKDPNINTAYEAYWFLQEHPAFFHPKHGDHSTAVGCFKADCLDIDIQMINPATRHIEHDQSLNTLQQVWLECGPYAMDEGKIVTTHDHRLDCGGDTFEDAIIHLANLVIKYYGDFRNDHHD